ncbi:MAG: GNAT family N-acetyltransferase [Bacteroidota bacterium]
MRTLVSADFDKLSGYLYKLSAETAKRFGPHGFDVNSIADLFRKPDNCLGYIALDNETTEIIAYSIVKQGFLEYDSPRLRSYGLILDSKTDCTFAPSVADAWQSLGVGNHLFHFVRSSLESIGIKRIILWGGVQSDNHKAVGFYRKNGFATLGEFEYNGYNFDMILEII